VINELEQLKRDNEVLYRDNVALSETADRLMEALEKIANFPVLLKSLVQSDRATIHGLKDIARAALEVRK